MACKTLLVAVALVALASCDRHLAGVSQQISLAVDVSQWTKVPTDETKNVWSEIEWEKKHAWVRQVIGINKRANWHEEYLTADDVGKGILALVALSNNGELKRLGRLSGETLDFVLSPGEWELVAKNEVTGAQAMLLAFEVDGQRPGRRGFLRIGPETEKSLLWVPFESPPPPSPK